MFLVCQMECVNQEKKLEESTKNNAFFASLELEPSFDLISSIQVLASGWHHSAVTAFPF